MAETAARCSGESVPECPIVDALFDAPAAGLHRYAAGRCETRASVKKSPCCCSSYRVQNVLMPIEETMPMTETGCEPQGSTRAGATEPIGEASSQRSQKLAVVGGILGAIAASSCCILPLALFSLGISGAWIWNLTALAPYQPYFIAATLACLGYGYWLVYRRKKIACAEGAACARPLPNHIVKAGLVLATILVAGAIAFDLFAPLLLNS